MARTQARRAGETSASARSAELDLSQLRGLLGYRLRQAQLAMLRDWMLNLRGLDLTQKQFALMLLVETNPGCSQIAVGAALGTDRATMMAIIDRLEDRNLLTRVRSRTDRRKQELYMTKAGRDLLTRALVPINAHEQRFSDMVGADEMPAFLSALDRMSEGGIPVPPGSEANDDD